MALSTPPDVTGRGCCNAARTSLSVVGQFFGAAQGAVSRGGQGTPGVGCTVAVLRGPLEPLHRIRDTWDALGAFQVEADGEHHQLAGFRLPVEHLPDDVLAILLAPGIPFLFWGSQRPVLLFILLLLSNLSARGTDQRPSRRYFLPGSWGSSPPRRVQNAPISTIPSTCRVPTVPTCPRHHMIYGHGSRTMPQTSSTG